MFKYAIAVILLLLGINLSHADEVAIGGKFSLVNVENKTVTEQDLLGKYNLVYFGYTTCHKICPMAVNNMSNVYDNLTPKQIDSIKMYFITVDSRLDDIQKVKDFLSNFDPRIVGLTGSKEQIEQVRNSYRVYVQRTTEKDPNGNPIINHSPFIYLMSPEGEYLTHFAHDASGEEIAKKIKTYLK